MNRWQLWIVVSWVGVFLGCQLPFVCRGQDVFVNWESSHTHPMDISPDGQTLLTCNTAAHRLEVFAINAGVPQFVRSIPVGLDPVAVRAESNSRAWVVNQVSDSVSVVDLSLGAVVATLATDDEPADVVFAGTPTRAFVSCSQRNVVLAFDPSNLDLPAVAIPIEGEEPRAMTVWQSGAVTRVLVACFESGNRTTVLEGAGLSGINYPINAVDNPAGPYLGLENPPPSPLLTGTEPKTAIVVQKSLTGVWEDENGSDWTTIVTGPPLPGSPWNASGRAEN